MIEERLREWAAARGYSCAIADLGVVETVRRKLEERRAAGMIQAGFFAENLTGFRYLEGSSIAGPACAVVLAVPSPISVLPVTVDGRKVETLIPPTYVRYNATFDDVLTDMKENALRGDFGAAILRAPLKSLAAHMGLVAYGRNNITYRPGLGSGHQLCGYVVGAAWETGERPMADEPPAAARTEARLERCGDCRACLQACPTGAIREDRFLISAERCFTLHSESRKPMPAWARPAGPPCLIGCLACQLVCPENKGLLTTAPSGVEFTAEETEAVIEAGRDLEMAAGAGLSLAARAEKNASFASALAKFERLGMTEDIEVMGRNLRLALAKGNNRKQ